MTNLIKISFLIEWGIFLFEIDIDFKSVKIYLRWWTMKDKLFQLSGKYIDDCFELNLYLADNPELGQKEYKALDAYEKILNKYGYQMKRGIMGFETCFISRICKSESLINIAIIAEYDAMPNGHSCGHSASGAASLLASLALGELGGDKFNLDLIGTADEEGEGLKIPLADQGFFDKYDMAIMVHMDSYNRPKVKALAYETNYFTFKGKASHAGGAPWDGNNALDGLTLMMHAMDMARQKLRDGSRLEGIILEGGKAPNTIPDFAKGMFTARTEKVNYLKEEVLPLLYDCARGAGIATRTEPGWTKYGYTYKDMLSLKTGEDYLYEIFEDLGLEVIEPRTPFGSTDMGNVSYSCPSFHPTISITDGKDVPLHTNEFESYVKKDGSKKVIENASKIILAMVARLVEDKEFRENLRDEFNKERA